MSDYLDDNDLDRLLHGLDVADPAICISAHNAITQLRRERDTLARKYGKAVRAIVDLAIRFHDARATIAEAARIAKELDEAQGRGVPWLDRQLLVNALLAVLDPERKDPVS